MLHLTQVSVRNQKCFQCLLAMSRNRQECPRFANTNLTDPDPDPDWGCALTLK